MCSVLGVMSDWEEDEESVTTLPLSAYFPGKVYDIIFLLNWCDVYMIYSSHCPCVLVNNQVLKKQKLRLKFRHERGVYKYEVNLR